MRTITAYSWAYQGYETDAMTCIVGLGKSHDEAVDRALGMAIVHGWEPIPHLAPAGVSAATRAQANWHIATLFVSDEQKVEADG